MIEARLKSFGIGGLIALVVLIAVWMVFLFGRADLPLALVVSSIAAIRL